MRHDASWASSELSRKTMTATRSRDTKPERALRSELHRRGLRFRVCVSPLPGLRRTADVLFPRRRIVVFVDGCFWHGCPEHYSAPKANADYWAVKLHGNRQRDADTTERLRLAGWQVIRLWEHLNVCDAADVVELAVRRQRQGRASDVAATGPSTVSP